MHHLSFRSIAAAATLSAIAVTPAAAGGWGYDHYRYQACCTPVFAPPPVVHYDVVPLPIPQEPVLIVNQGPTFPPTIVNYITPTVTYARLRVFPYGSSGYPAYAVRAPRPRYYDPAPGLGYK